MIPSKQLFPGIMVNMSVRKKIASLLETNADPFRAAKAWKARCEGKVIGYLLPDVPEEIIHACGFFPLPVLSADRQSVLAEGRLPSFVCYHLRDTFEMALQGELDFIDGMVIPYVCDSTRAFSQIWECNFSGLFNHTLWLPKKTEGDFVKEFLLEEFLRLKEKLVSFAKIDVEREDLRNSIRLYNRNRMLLRELSKLKEEGRLGITLSEYVGVIKSSMFIEKERINSILEDLLLDVKERHGPAVEKEQIPIILFDPICETPSITEKLEELGMYVVAENLNLKTRYIGEDADEQMDPIEALVNRQLAKNPLSCFHYTEDQWIQYLTKAIDAHRVRGAVYLTLKYCEPSEFDYPFVKECLHELRIPVLYLEVDSPSQTSAQIITRLEAFAEMLQGVE